MSMTTALPSPPSPLAPDAEDPAVLRAENSRLHQELAAAHAMLANRTRTVHIQQGKLALQNEYCLRVKRRMEAGKRAVLGAEGYFQSGEQQRRAAPRRPPSLWAPRTCYGVTSQIT